MIPGILSHTVNTIPSRRERKYICSQWHQFPVSRQLIRQGRLKLLELCPNRGKCPVAFSPLFRCRNIGLSFVEFSVMDAICPCSVGGFGIVGFRRHSSDVAMGAYAFVVGFHSLIKLITGDKRTGGEIDLDLEVLGNDNGDRIPSGLQVVSVPGGYHTRIIAQNSDIKENGIFLQFLDLCKDAKLRKHKILF